jgi:exopolysaccharide biosynthesis polyprenyl glycosylphosphotransferase
MAEMTRLSERTFPQEFAWPESTGRSLARRERQFILAFGDAAVWLLLSGFLAYMHWGPVSFRVVASITVISWLLIGYFAGMYRLNTAARIRSSFEALLKTAVAVDAVLLLAFYLHPEFVSRINLLIMALGGPALLGIWRYLGGRFIAASKFERRVVVVGGGSCCASLLEAIDSTEGHGVRVVGIVDEDEWSPAASVRGIPVLGHVSAVWNVVHEFRAEEVILALEQPPGPRLADEVAKCYEHGVAVSLMPHVYGEVAGQVPVEHMGSHWLGAVALTRPGGWLYETLKRLLDISVSSVALIVLLPVIAVVAVAIRLTSSGPTLFRQARLGLHGRPFTLLKFRSMRVGTSDVTGVGKVLRVMHLDELPQLVNVLRGDMSLVGPRPKRAAEGRLLEMSIPLYRARQSVRPGLTGWAQIAYRYAHSPEDEMIKLRYDLYYIQHQSLLLDIVIIVRTFAQVIGRRGF